MVLKITDVEAIPIVIPLIHPLRMAVATVYQRESIFVRLHTRDGLVGYGEAVLAQYFTGETWAGAKHSIDRILKPLLCGADAYDRNSIIHNMDKVLHGCPGTKAAVDIALHDLVAKSLNIPLYQLLGGKVRDRVYSTWHVASAEPEAIADEAMEGIAQGFKAVKIKVGKQDPKTDLRRIMAVRKAVGEDILLRPDANQAWSVPVAIQFIKAAGECGLQFIEQPVNRRNIAGMARIVQAVDVAVAPDEGVFHAGDALNYIRAEAADGVILKLIKTGGLLHAQELANLIQAADLDMHLAGFPGETSVCAAAEAHLAVSLPQLSWDCGISSHYAQRDIVAERLLPVDGAYYPPTGPGLGIEIDEEALNECRMDR